MNLTTWLALATVCILGAITPGLSLALVMKHTIGISRAHGVAAALGHGSGVVLYALATLMGLTVILTTHPALFHAIAWSGAAYLIWIGIRSMRAKGDLLQTEARSQPLPVWRSAREGFTIALLNPKLAIFFLALFSQFVTPQQTAATRAVMVATVGGIDTGWYVLVAILLSRSSVLAKVRARQLWVNRATGVVMLLLGLRVLML